MKNPEVFLSYAWGGESETIVNELDTAFKNKGIELIRDKRDLGFKGMITEFMQRIGEGHAVIIVIADKYLKSPYCMFELLEVYRNLNFQKRIFPIVMNDANIFDPIPRLQYLKYWQDKKKELDESIMQFGTDAITVIGEDYKINKKIFDNYGEIINILKDINSLTPNIHREGNFETIIEAITKLINSDKTNLGKDIEPVNWKFILKTLKDEKCILFLGPELFRTEDNAKSKQQVYFEQLAVENPEKILSYNQDGFFIFSKPEERISIFLKLVDFFETQHDEDIIRKIAEIPFHTIVSLNPDNLLKRFFVQNNQPHSFEYFDKNNKKEISAGPSKERPLIYNLFGSIVKDETLLLSFDDLFEYFSAMMGNNFLPEILRDQLQNAKDLIFLGFQFDKWYIQLILNLLKLNDENNQFIRYALPNRLSNDAQSLCINYFKIQFVDPDNKQFINTLHQACMEAGMLRNFNNPSSEDSLDENVKDIKQKIDREETLLKDRERMLGIEKNAIRQFEIEEEIEGIKEKISRYEKEIESITQS